MVFLYVNAFHCSYFDVLEPTLIDCGRSFGCVKVDVANNAGRRLAGRVGFIKSFGSRGFHMDRLQWVEGYGSAEVVNL